MHGGVQFDDSGFGEHDLLCAVSGSDLFDWS
jgi:hypothetical protein